MGGNVNKGLGGAGFITRDTTKYGSGRPLQETHPLSGYRQRVPWGHQWGIPWGGIPVATMANYKGARRGNPGSLEGRQATRKPF